MLSGKTTSLSSFSQFPSMIVSANRILGFVTAESVIQVYDQEGRPAFKADYARIQDLCERGQVCGKVRGAATLRSLELIVPLSEAASTRRELQTPGSVNARTNIGAYRQHLDAGSCWSLCLSRAFDGARA